MAEDAARDIKIAELEILRQSLDDKKDQLLRLAAEFDNYRKRVVREREQVAYQSRADVLRSALLIYDALDKACAGLPSGKKSGSLSGSGGKSGLDTADSGVPAGVGDGLVLLQQSFHQFMDEQEVVPIESVGKKYDPHLHEVVDKMPSEEEEGIIIDEVQKGYMLSEHVLRHAKVRISAGKAGKEQE